MKFQLYQATDNRDNRVMLWLHDTHNHRVATFCLKNAPSRIKHRTQANPDGIIWEPESVMVCHAALPTAVHIDAWGE